MSKLNRQQVLRDVAERIIQMDMHPTRVAIDGVDAAGKTTFADELAPIIEAAGRPVIRASVDGFHNPARVRYRRGEGSPDGYYRDSFNYRRLIEVLLAPLGPSGSRRYRSVIFDYRTERDVDRLPATAGERSVLLFDGVFLQRPELREYWDYTIFLDVDFEVTLARAMQRHLGLSPEEVRNRYENRYIPGQKLYLDECMPGARADIVIDNSNLADLVVSYIDEKE